MNDEVNKVLAAAERAKKVTWETRHFDDKKFSPSINLHRDRLIAAMKEARCKPGDKYLEVMCPDSKESSQVSVPDWEANDNISRKVWNRDIWHKIPVEVLANLDCEMAGPFRVSHRQGKDAEGIPLTEMRGGQMVPKIERINVPTYAYVARACGQKEDD